MHIEIPKLSLVVLIGPSGSGKSTFARKHFRSTEVLSSDYFRGLVSDDENNQAVSADAFDALHYMAAKRLALGRLTVIDATNVQPESRAPLVALAKKYHCLPVAIVFDLPEHICHSRNQTRSNRTFGPHVVRQQRSQMRRNLRDLRREGFRSAFVMHSVEEVDAAVIERVPLWNDRTDESGPFDIIGDVHGCADELELLLEQLGYVRGSMYDSAETSLNAADAGWGDVVYRHPAGRKAIFVGDLVDRGPRVLDVLRIVRNMINTDSAICVPGNHDMKLLRKLNGKDVRITHGLETTLAEIDALSDEVRQPFCAQLAKFLDGLVSHYVLDGGRLVVAHAGMKESMQGRGSGKVREFALYGESSGEIDEFGLPIRLEWAADYRGKAMVVYGHTPVPTPSWLNNTVNIDTGCVFGGHLTALRYPEQEIVSVPAKMRYYKSSRPFPVAGTSLTSQQLHDDLLNITDVLGKRIIVTRLHNTVTIREQNSVAAMEVMSRFAVDPKWLIYLPPTMSPGETSTEADLLEHPAEVFTWFLNQGVPQVVCEKKHMGSRAIAVVCRDADAARDRFGVRDGKAGIVYTRTGRAFFNDDSMEHAIVDRLQAALTTAGFWDEFKTTWVCLDCELMPWSAKAQELLRNQYAAVGAAGRAALPVVVDRIAAALCRSDLPTDETAFLQTLKDRYSSRCNNLNRFVDAYRQYCWDVDSVEQLRLAPFHLLATEGRVHSDRTNVWHMETLTKVCSHDSVLLATEFIQIDVADPASVEWGIAWWEQLTSAGGEGMVVKPLDFAARNNGRLVQPAIKCRGREYLRIIYGPDYQEPEHLPRLRRRGVGAKRSLALREFALGIEALERFVRKEPLARIHECVFGVLALESEPVDPRL